MVHKLYCERYLSIQSILGKKKKKKTNISTVSAYTYLPKANILNFFLKILWTFPVWASFQFHLVVADILNLARESHIASNPGGKKAHDSHDYHDDDGHYNGDDDEFNFTYLTV